MKRTLVKLLVILFALLISVGSTIAYLTDVEQEVNVMTLGRVEIDLIEQERNTTGSLVQFQDKHPLYPGVHNDKLVVGTDGYWVDVRNAIDKIVTVKNTGRAPAYVRLWFAFEVTGEVGFFDEKIHLNRNTADWQWEFMKNTDGSYQYLEVNGSRYVVATATYNKVLAPDATTPVSLRQVLLDSSATNDDYINLGDKYSIFVVAQAMQTEGFDSAAEALAEGFGVPSVGNHPFAGMKEPVYGEPGVIVPCPEPTYHEMMMAMSGYCTYCGENACAVMHDTLMEREGMCKYCGAVSDEKPTVTPVPDDSGVPENCPQPTYHSMCMAMSGYCPYCGENACAVMHDTLMEREGKCKWCGAVAEKEGCKHTEKLYIRTNAQVHTIYCKNSSCEVWNLGTETHTYVNGICVCGATNGNAPTNAPTQKPTAAPTAAPTQAPTKAPTSTPTVTVSPEIDDLFEWTLNKDKTGINITRYIGTNTKVVIPEIIEGLPVISIGDFAFQGHNSLTSITIPDSVSNIGNFAFSTCTSLTSITIPDSVTSIGVDAFIACTSLTSITIPDSVTSIGDGAFSACTSLTSIQVAANNTHYVSIDGVLFTRDLSTLHNYPAGKKGGYSIPDSVTSISDEAFLECTSLTSITIPDSVTNIGPYVFGNCTSLTSVTIPDSVTSIGMYAFAGCSSLTSITIPDSVTSIGDFTFSRCTSLTSITIPASVTSIGNNVFEFCDNYPEINVYKGSYAHTWFSWWNWPRLNIISK